MKLFQIPKILLLLFLSDMVLADNNSVHIISLNIGSTIHTYNYTGTKEQKAKDAFLNIKNFLKQETDSYQKNIIALQEVDVLTTRNGKINHPLKLIEYLDSSKWIHHFGHTAYYSNGDYGIDSLTNLQSSTFEEWNLGKIRETRKAIIQKIVGVIPNRTLYVINTHLTHMGKDNAFNQLNKILENIKSQINSYDIVVIIGDLNINTYQNNANLIQLEDKSKSYGFELLGNQNFTYIKDDQTVHRIIDHVLIFDKFNILLKKELEVYTSSPNGNSNKRYTDHNGLGISLEWKDKWNEEWNTITSFSWDNGYKFSLNNGKEYTLDNIYPQNILTNFQKSILERAFKDKKLIKVHLIGALNENIVDRFIIKY